MYYVFFLLFIDQKLNCGTKDGFNAKKHFLKNVQRKNEGKKIHILYLTTNILKFSEACKDVDAINEYIRKNFFDEEALSIYSEKEIKDYGLSDSSKHVNETLLALEKLDPSKTQISVIVSDDSDEDSSDLIIDDSIKPEIEDIDGDDGSSSFTGDYKSDADEDTGVNDSLLEEKDCKY